MLEAGTTVGVDVGVGVFDLADLPEDSWDRLEADLHEVHDLVVFDVALREVLEMDETGVGVAQDGVAVAWDDAAFSEGLVHELGDDLFAWFPAGVEFLK